MTSPGFVREGATASLQRGLLPVGRRPGRRYISESLDGSARATTTIGEGYVLVTVQPEDLRDPLRRWLAGGGSTKVEYRPAAKSSDGAVTVSIYVDRVEEIDDPSWYRRPTTIRIVPRDGAKMGDLLVALGLNDLVG